MKSKIIQIPISSSEAAEAAIQEALNEIEGTVVNTVPLSNNCLAIFYNESSSGSGGGTEDPGTGGGTGGGEDPGTGGGEDPGTGGGTEDPGTGGGTDPGTGGGTGGTEDPGTGEETETIVPIEEDPYEGKFGDYVIAGQANLGGATSRIKLSEFGEMGDYVIRVHNEKLEEGESVYEDWWYNDFEKNYLLYAYAVTADLELDNEEYRHYDALIALYGSPQVSTARNYFNMAEGTVAWELYPGDTAEDTELMFHSTFMTNVTLVLLKRPSTT